MALPPAASLAEWAVEPCTDRAAQTGQAGLYNFEKPSGRAGPGREVSGPGRAGLVSTAREVAMTSLIADRGVYNCQSLTTIRTLQIVCSAASSS